MLKKGPRSDQDNCSLTSAFISIGFPLYLSLSILQWKDIKVATRDIIPLRPSALPRNGISLLNVAVNDIHELSIEHNMKLNPKKCKEMLIKFMQNDSFTIRPIVFGNNTVERVKTYKLHVIISNDLKWNEHID